MPSLRPDMPSNRWNFPDLGLGLGLRGEHIPWILQHRPHFGSDGQPGWFEVIADNALIHQGWLRHALDRLAETYPLVLHGVTLNIGSTDLLDLAYLRGIKALADRWHAPWISDHVCWTGVNGLQSHDLLPVPYSEPMLAWMAQRVRQVQDVLERPLVLENPSTYLQFRQTTMPEWEFLARLCEMADCGLLLDVNNVYVSAMNHDFAWQTYLQAVPWDRVCQMHVAGHTTLATHLFDSHIGPVDPPVWDVLRAAFQACGGRSLLLEWDFEIPDFAQVAQEAQVAWSQVAEFHQRSPLSHHIPLYQNVPLPATDPAELHALQSWMLDAVIAKQPVETAEKWLLPHGRLSPAERLQIHARMYVARLEDALREDYPVLMQTLGQKPFDDLIAQYRQQTPSRAFALEEYGREFPAWLCKNSTELAHDIALVERARTEALLAPQSPPFDPQVLQRLQPEDHARILLEFQPSVRIVTLNHPLVADWPHVQKTPKQQELVLVWRQNWQVHQRVLHPLEAALLRLLQAGTALGPAVEALADAELAAHVGTWFSSWSQSGILSGVSLQ